MTRETKLALLLGLGLFILIGIIVTEYMAMTHVRGDGEPIAQTDGEPVTEVPPPPGSEPAVVADQPVRRVDRQVSGEGARERPQPRPTTGDQRSRPFNPVTFDSDRGLLARTVEEQRTTAGPTPARTGTGAGDLLPPDRRVSNEPPPLPAGSVTHRVERGESLWKIAERYYGDGNAWRRIRDANSDMVSATGGVREGLVLVIPDAGQRTSLGGATAAVANDGRGPVRANAEQSVDRGGAYRMHQVEPSDTLWSIAQRYLGDGSRWQEIRDLNREVITDPHRLDRGLVIRIPR